MSDYRSGTRPEDAIEQPLTDDGTASGAFNLVGNYASPTTVWFEALRPCILTRMIVSLSDAGAFDADKYGNNITLTNGISLVISDADDVVLLDLLPEGNIKTNGEWAAKCHDFTNHGFGVGNAWASARWTFGRDMISDGFLLGAGYKFKAILNDDFTGLVRHRLDIRGEYL